MDVEKQEAELSTLKEQPRLVWALRRLSRRLTRRQQLLLLLLLAACLSTVLVMNVARRRSHRPPRALPTLGYRAAHLYDLGIVDGEVPDPEYWTEEEATAPPRSWAWLEDDQEAPKRALLTPEYLLDASKSGVGAQKLDADTIGKHVRVLWIGDLSGAPEMILDYLELGFNVTVHTSADSILDGFVPHVRRAYERAIPAVAGFDFLKLLLLYKLGGLVVDADTRPVVNATDIELPAGCSVMLGKETHLRPDQFTKPIYRQTGGPTYLFNRPFQLLNWAMMATEPRNRHVEEFITASMRHFLGLRDMEFLFVQDVAGSGMLSDYVALLHEQHGLDYAAAFKDRKRLRPIEGLCMLDDELRGRWIRHAHMATWYV